MDNLSSTEITSKVLFDSLESMILSNPDSDGIQIEDAEGRTWLIQLTKSNNQYSKVMH